MIGNLSPPQSRQKELCKTCDSNMSSKQPAPNSVLERSIGADVRRRRAELGIGLTTLAKASGISPGMLSRIERGLTSPSLKSLQALALALHVPLGALFSTFDHLRPAIFTRAGAGPNDANYDQESVRCVLLGKGFSQADVLSPQLITIQSAQSYPDLTPVGVLFLYILAGQLSYSHGSSIFQMQRGDSLIFDAEIPHRIETVSKFPTKLLVVRSILAHPLAKPKTRRGSPLRAE